MNTLADWRPRLEALGQAHLLQFESELAPAAQAELVAQLQSLPLDRLASLYAKSNEPSLAIDPHQLAPIPAIALPSSAADKERYEHAYGRGLQALQAGRVAALLVAGGQGSRLGFEHPKGMFPIGTVQQTSLFEIFAHSLRYWRQKFQCTIPWAIMTSPGNRDETESFFRSHQFFGLPENDVHFFVQGEMPAVDATTGKILLAVKGKIFTSPDGHGGTLTALRQAGLLEQFDRQGIDLIYYFQVDNPLAKLLDPAFLGYHLESQAEASVKVVRKRHPTEKVGLVVQYNGKPTVIEYSDLPDELAHATDVAGDLLYWAGNIAIHVFSRTFLERLTQGEGQLPFHIARKKVPHLNSAGETVDPDAPNGLKFEMFIFDTLPLAERVAVVETAREEEFAPVKNASGADSPAEVQSLLNRRAARWLRRAGHAVALQESGEPEAAIEISPLLGPTYEEFQTFARGLRVPENLQTPTFLGPPQAGNEVV